MVYRKISNDLKEAALRLKARGRDTVYDIVAITGFSIRTFYRVRQQKLRTGSVAKQDAIGRGRPRTLLRHDCEYLLRLARYKPTLFLDEYSQCLEQYRALSVSLATIHRTLERAGLNVKHVQKLAAERDPFLRQTSFVVLDNILPTTSFQLTRFQRMTAHTRGCGVEQQLGGE